MSLTFPVVWTSKIEHINFLFKTFHSIKKKDKLHNEWLLQHTKSKKKKVYSESWSASLHLDLSTQETGGEET